MWLLFSWQQWWKSDLTWWKMPLGIASFIFHQLREAWINGKRVHVNIMDDLQINQLSVCARKRAAEFSFTSLFCRCFLLVCFSFNITCATVGQMTCFPVLSVFASSADFGKVRRTTDITEVKASSCWFKESLRGRLTFSQWSKSRQAMKWNEILSMKSQTFYIFSVTEVTRRLTCIEAAVDSGIMTLVEKKRKVFYFEMVTGTEWKYVARNSETIKKKV